MSPTIFNLAAAQQGAWSKRAFRRDHTVRRIVLRKLFWRATAEVVSRLWQGHPLPDTVAIIDPDLSLKMTPEDWQALTGEIGLAHESGRAMARGLLEITLWGMEKNQAEDITLEGLSREGGWILPGLMLVTIHLAKTNPNTTGAFEYRFSELNMVARWLRLSAGALPDEGQLASDIFRLAGMNTQEPSRFLETPYRCYFEPLCAMMESGGYRPAPRPIKPATAVRPDVLLRAMKEPSTDQTPPVQKVPLEPTEGALHQDAAFLRRQMDLMRLQCERLRATQCADLLVLMMDPALRRAEDVRKADTEIHGLAKEVLESWLRVVRHADLELFGILGEKMQLTLPDEDFELDLGLPVSNRDLSRGTFTLVCRGLRVRGHTVVTAKVVPSYEDHGRHS